MPGQPARPVDRRRRWRRHDARGRLHGDRRGGRGLPGRRPGSAFGGRAADGSPRRLRLRTGERICQRGASAGHEGHDQGGRQGGGARLEVHRAQSFHGAGEHGQNPDRAGPRGASLVAMSSLGQTSFAIRTATRKDLPAIMGIYNWAINQTFATIDPEPLSREEAAAWWDAHASRILTLVAEDEGDVIGWAQLLPWRQRGYEVVEDLVYVDPVYQKNGVGRELLARGIEAGRTTGCKTH